jgi:hypothetical protein
MQIKGVDVLGYRDVDADVRRGGTGTSKHSRHIIMKEPGHSGQRNVSCLHLVCAQLDSALLRVFTSITVGGIVADQVTSSLCLRHTSLGYPDLYCILSRSILVRLANTNYG